MTLGYHEDHAARTIEITVAGRVTREDFDAVAPKIERFMHEHGPIRLIEIVHHLDGFDPGLLWDGVKLDFRLMPHITHCAVVGDAPWLSPLARATSAVMPMKLRTFRMAELDAAREWIAAAETED